ncbi:hypothetical protein DTO027I6_1917 [Penicillium roqueforti]|nr:hypothetical protein DTO039G3_375 [Penicillium roqueforti]KAI3219212.1 hypothetical protein DTO027I6_1917 [Penicillium roqueforti]
MSTFLDKAASNGRWQFIDSSKNRRTNLTQVKRHVMQEYMRQKKGGTRQSESEEEAPQAKRGERRKTRGAQRRSEKKANSDGDNKNNEPRVRRSTRIQQATRREDLNGEANCDMFVLDSISSDPPLIESNDMPRFPPRSSSVQSHDVPLLLDDFIDVNPQSCPSYDLHLNNFSWPPPSMLPYQFVPSPTTMISDAQFDTFNTLPIELERDAHGIFDSYVNDMPASSYETHYQSPMANDCYTPTFVSGIIKDETQNPLVHSDPAVSVLQEHRSDNPHEISDDAIISCLNTAALEDSDPRLGHKEISQVHMRDAREMTNWQNYILPGDETFFYDYDQHAPASSETLPPAPQPTLSPRSMLSPLYSTSSGFSEVSPEPQPTFPPYSEAIPADEIQYEELFDFLRSCEQLVVY